MVGNKSEQELIRIQMVADARASFRWDNVAEEWNAEFNKCSRTKLKERVLK